MTPSLFLIQLAILLLPGVLWARVETAYGNKRDQSQFEFAVRVILFGLTSYAITYALFLLANAPFEMIDLAKAADGNVLSRGIVIQTLWAILIGFVGSIIWLYAINYKVLTRLLQLIGATRRYGDEDVWEFTFNSNTADLQFVHIRDFANKMVYAGWVSVFSETEKLRELVLSEVDIYDFDGNLISSPPRLYISRNPDGLHIEFPIQPTPNEA